MDFWEEFLGAFPGTDFLEECACPGCGSTRARSLGPLGPARLERCGACGLVYGSPRLSTAAREALYRLNPGEMHAALDARLRVLMAQRCAQMRREMFPAPREGGSLFEIGCGWGHFLEACRTRFSAVAGAEPSREQAAHARSRFGLDVTEADVFARPPSPAHDLIAAWEVLEHVPDPARMLAWACAALKPGGQVALSTPNFGSLYRRLLGPRWFYFIPSQHLSYFTARTLSAMLRRAGFSEVRVRTSGRSLLRERGNAHNRATPGLGPREAWLENLRLRSDVESEREAVSLDRSTPAKRIRHGLAWRALRPLLHGGFGDQLRVYARKA
jgi:2-polyprenyl-3-methyl-5-hydroxy-6-metoxy-1,4-benzoquinol methylase